MSERLQNDCEYVAIIEEFYDDDGICKYGYYDKDGNLILGTVGDVASVKQNPKYRKNI